MSDRGVLLLFSLVVILAAASVAVWLIATGQVAYIDGLFLFLCCLVVALAFSLYVRYLIRNAMAAPATEAMKASAAAGVKPATPAPVEQTLQRAR